MRIALLTFDGFDEIGTFLALGLLNRLATRGWTAELACPTSYVTSMNGVTVQAQQPLEFAADADAVVFGHSLYSRAIAADSALLDRLQFDPVQQFYAGHSGGSLMLARLGLLGDAPACADAALKPWLVEAGVRVDEHAFRARGSVATAAGPLAASFIAAWLMIRGAGLEAATSALRGVAPVGEENAWTERLLGDVTPFVDAGHEPPP